MPRASKTGVRGLYKAGGRFQIDLRYRDPRGVAHRFVERLPPGLSSAAAKERARQVLNQAFAGTLTLQRTSPAALTLHVAFERYLDWCRQNRPKTFRDRAHLVRILKKHLANGPVVDISQIMLERFKRARANEVKPATINRAVAMFKHFAGRALHEGWISESVARSVRGVALLKEPPGRVRYLSADEQQRLLSALRPDVRDIVLTALLTGMRRGEIVALRKASIDFDAKLIHLTETKTNRARHLPLHDTLVPILRAACERSPSHLVFSTESGSSMRHKVSDIFRATVRRLGIADLRFHDLRHDFATKLRRSGTGLDLIAALLGHTTLAMTQRYAHLGRDELRAAVQQIAAPPT